MFAVRPRAGLRAQPWGQVMTRQISADEMRILRMEDALQRRREMALHASEIGVFEFEPSTGETFWDDRVRGFWGVSADEPTNYDLVIRGVHPGDRALHDLSTEQALDPNGSGHLDITYRLYPLDGSPMRWMRAIASCYFDGDTPVRLVGTVQDVTAEKTQEQRNDVLLYELEHRVKNTLSTAIAVLDLSRIGQTDIDNYFTVAADRLRAIALSHDSLRRGSWTDVDLSTLLGREAERFLGAKSDRLKMHGDPVAIPAHNVMTMSMVLHELLTNAAKHGALAQDGGRIDVTTKVEAEVTHLIWQESLPNPTQGADGNGVQGFGSILLEHILPAEIGATTERKMTRKGLLFSLTFPNLMEPTL